MKKILIVLCACLLLPAVLQARPFAPAAAASGSVDLLASAFLAKASSAYKEDMKNQAAKADVKARESLKVVMSAYPSRAALIAEVAYDHRNLVEAAGQVLKGAETLQNLVDPLESLYRDFMQLQKADPAVAAQVKTIINHSYWFAAEEQNYTVARLAYKVQMEFPQLTLEGAEWLGSLK